MATQTLQQVFQNTATAIREVGGTKDKILPENMAEAVRKLAEPKVYVTKNKSAVLAENSTDGNFCSKWTVGSYESIPKLNTDLFIFPTSVQVINATSIRNSDPRFGLDSSNKEDILLAFMLFGLGEKDYQNVCRGVYCVSYNTGSNTGIDFVCGRFPDMVIARKSGSHGPKYTVTPGAMEGYSNLYVDNIVIEFYENTYDRPTSSGGTETLYFTNYKATVNAAEGVKFLNIPHIDTYASHTIVNVGSLIQLPYGD